MGKGGGNKQAAQSVKIAQAQYDLALAQENKRKAEEAAAKANAGSSRLSANMAYANDFSGSTNVSGGNQGNYSLLTSTAAGSPSVIGTLYQGGENRFSSTLGG